MIRTRPKIGRTAALVAAALALAGCGGGGSAGSGGSVAAGTTPGAHAGTGASQAHWTTALAALSTPIGAPALDDAALARWNDLLALQWRHQRLDVDRGLESSIRSALLGITGGTVTVQQVRSISLDTSLPPALGRAPSPAPIERLEVRGPGDPAGWTVEVAAVVGTTIQRTVLGIPVTVGISLDVTARATGVRLIATADIDASVAARPVFATVGTPQISMRLDISSSDPLLQQIAADLTRALDPVVRAGLFAAALAAQQQILGTLAQVNPTPWGLGGPGPAPVTAPASLLAIAGDISDEIQRHHLPFCTVLPVIFDRTGYKNGAPSRYQDYGDSACWTGHYLAAESLHYDTTGDPRALAGARRVLDGLEACLSLWSPTGGRLSRVVIPLTAPAINDIRGGSEYLEGDFRGVRYGGLGYISRDQYIGTMLGLTYAHLRAPPLRADAARLIGRVVAQLEADDWIAYEINSPAISAPFAQAADVLWSFVKAANLADRARWAALHDPNRDLSRLLWLPVWLSSREVHEEYYKFNLMHSSMATLVALETDPGLYRGYLQAFEIARDVTGHHENAWFDAIYGVAVPTAALAQGALVEMELQRWALRDRRGFPVQNSADPAIARTLYSSPLLAQTPPHWVADRPIPIERRPCGDFLWQTSPFQLDGGQSDPYLQQAGIDLLLPYWLCRSYGMIR